jgi:hypothetical protein
MCGLPLGSYRLSLQFISVYLLLTELCPLMNGKNNPASRGFGIACNTLRMLVMNCKDSYCLMDALCEPSFKKIVTSFESIEHQTY